MPEIKGKDKVALYVETHGSGIPVIFSCPYCATHENWQGQVEHLVTNGFQAIFWDYRGHGKSGIPEGVEAYTLDNVLDDLDCVLEWSAKGKRVVLVGHSFGGFASLHFALRHPRKVLALIIVASGPGFKSQKAAESWIAQTDRTAVILEQKGFISFIQNAGATIIGRQPDLPAAQRAAKAIMAQNPYEAAKFGRYIVGPAPSIIDDLPNIDCPSLVVVGEDDTRLLKAVDVIAAKLPNAQKATVPGAGHILNIEAPDVFNKMITDFINSIKKQR